MEDTIQAQLVKLRQLGAVLPKGTTDAHFHVFGPAERYPYASERDFTPADALPSQAGTLFSAAGIERAVLVQASVYGNDNSRHLSAAGELGIPARVVVSIGAELSDLEFARFDGLGAKAVRLMVAKHGWPDRVSLQRLCSRLAERGWHLQLFAKSDQLVELEDFVGSLACPVVLDHLGLIDPRGGVEQPGFQAMLRLLKGGRCSVKISGYYRFSRVGAPYSDLTDFVHALVQAAPERLLWGSDWPHPAFSGPPPSLADLIEAFLEWVPDQAVRQMILVDNPAALFGFEAAAGETLKKRSV